VSWLVDRLVEPWQAAIVVRGLVGVVLVAAIGGLLGVFLAIRGLAFATEALTHIAFPGAVVAAAAGGSIIAGGLVAAALGAVAIVLARQVGPTSDDTAIGIVFTGAFAGGAILAVTLGPLPQDVSSFLFGSLFGVSTGDLVVTAVATLAIAGVMVIIRRDLIIGTFHADAAGHAGRVRRTDAVFLATLAVGVVVASRLVGTVLAVALLVTPAATARRLCRRLRSTLVVAIGAGVASALGGIYLSYYASVAAGGAVVLVSTSLLVIALLATWRPRRPAAAGRAVGGRPART
jgi:ABC-type Mn2+/Zn2+ transport system permease subunit